MMLVSGYWILKYNDLYLIQHPASSIQYLVDYGTNVDFKDFLTLVPDRQG